MPGRCSSPEPRRRAWRRRGAATALLALATASAGAQTALVDEIRVDGLLNSHVAFTDLSLDAACRKSKAAGCKTNTTARYIPLDAAEKVTKELELAWKDFQESAYFHLNAQLNVGMPMGVTGAFPNCLTGIGGQGIKPRNTPVTTRVEDSHISQDLLKLLSPKLKNQLPIKPTDGVHWDAFGQYAESNLFPKVPTRQFCQDPSVTPRFFPPDNSYFVFPTSAYQSSHSENGFTFGPFPQPQAVNWGELAARLRTGCNNIWSTLYPKYLQRVAKAVAPLALTSTVWNPENPGSALVPGTRGPVSVQPVYLSNPADFPSTLKKLTDVITNTLDPRAPQYYGMTGTFGPNMTRPGLPGVATLETPKRFFPVMPLQAQYKSGTVNLLQIYTQVDVVREQRPLTLWVFATACAGFWPSYGCTLVPAVPLPAPETLLTGPTCVAAAAPGAGGFTMTLPRFHYQYVSVPEGYPVPDLNGDPAVLRN